MEVTLIQDLKDDKVQCDNSFNPCFNGSYSYTYILVKIISIRIYSFNPCFNGSYSYTQ